MPPNKSWQEHIADKEKALEPLIQRAVDRVREAVGSLRPKITSSFFYGAVGLDPKHLVIWYVFATEAQKAEAKTDGLLAGLDQKSREALLEEGYALPALEAISVSFASDEEINRAGGFRNFFA